MLRTELIAQIEAEIDRLAHARDVLAHALKNHKKASGGKVKAKKGSLGKNRKRSKETAAPDSKSLEGREIPKPASQEPEQRPSVRLVPPKRRRERHSFKRVVSPEGAGKVHAALSGFLPPGPIAVSAHEARKAEARNANPLLSSIESEVPMSPSSERSLGTLVRAFERTSRLKGIEPS